jgi:hypothetical protein
MRSLKAGNDMQNNNSISSKSYLLLVKAMYLGNEPMGELLEGENGSDAIQAPLKRIILRTEGVGEEVNLTLTNNAIIINFVTTRISNVENQSLSLSIDMLAYCGALRQVPKNMKINREFETLDKSLNDINTKDPPLFVTIFRNIQNENTLFCYAFVVEKDEEAMELVKLVMEIYYSIIRLQEYNDRKFYDDYHTSSKEVIKSTNNLNEANLENTKGIIQKNYNFETNINETVLHNIERIDLNNPNPLIIRKDDQNSRQHPSYESFYSNSMAIQPTNIENEVRVLKEIDKNKKDQEVKETSSDIPNRVSTSEIISKRFPEEYYNILGKDEGHNSKSPEINSDSDPIIIKKPNNEQIVYKQNVFIRWLQPPTPPPPAPIISK